MSQSHLDSLSYILVKEEIEVETHDLEEIVSEDQVNNYTEAEDEDTHETVDKTPKRKYTKKKKETEKSFENIDSDISVEKNLIRKVEMNLDYETDIHIYEDKFKIIVKKQAPFYMSKKTWKLLLKRNATINTASKLTEL